MQLPTTLLRRSIARPSFLPTITATTTTTRPFSLSPLNQARKDTQDKDSLKPEPTEYSKSGSDDAAAATEKAAFDPSSTRPEEEQNIAGRESGGDANPLEASPANQDISKDKSENEGGTGNPAQGQVTKSRESAAASGSGSGPKAGGGKSG